MKTTRYFEEQVLRKRPYIKREWCEEALKRPLRSEVRGDRRVRFWCKVFDLDVDKPRYLRVVLADRKTVHNAFYDRNFDELAL